MCRRHFHKNPFQLDLFIARVRLGYRALLALRSSVRLFTRSGVEVTFRFVRNGLFFFESRGLLFSATAHEAAWLELSKC